MNFHDQNLKITKMKKTLLYLLLFVLSIPGFAQVERKVIIEHFTNSRCGICSIRNPIFYQTIENYPQVLHIAYHPSAPYASCIFSQHNPAENDDRTYFYGIYGATPRVVIQGEVIPPQTPLITSAQIEDKLGGQSDYELSVTNTAVSRSSFNVKLTITRVSGNPGLETIRVFAGLAEETIDYNAPNGETKHHDVFRRRVFYDTVNMHNVGDTRIIEREYSMHQDWNADEIYSYAIIHDMITQEVKQSASSTESPSLINNNTTEEISSIFYPNPASSTITIQPEYQDRFTNVELYSFIGNRVGDFGNTTQLNVSELPDGMYFIVATDKQNRRFTSRLIVNH